MKSSATLGHRQTVRYAADDFAVIEAAAAAAGYAKASTFVRQAALQAAALVFGTAPPEGGGVLAAAVPAAGAARGKPAEQEPRVIWSFADDQGALRRANALRALGTNVNQIARAVNLVQAVAEEEGGTIPDARVFTQALNLLPPAEELSRIGGLLMQAYREEREFADGLAQRLLPGGAERERGA